MSKIYLSAIVAIYAFALADASAKQLDLSDKYLMVINQVDEPVYLYFQCVDPKYTYTSIPAAKNNHPSQLKMSVDEMFAKCTKYEIIAYTKLVDKPDWTLTSGKCADLLTEKHEQITINAIGNSTLGNLKITCKTLSHK